MDHFFFFIALLFIRNDLATFGRVVSFEVCCQWALLSVQITRLLTLGFHQGGINFCIRGTPSGGGGRGADLNTRSLWRWSQTA